MGLEIFLPGRSDHSFGKARSGGSFVPSSRFQPVAHELFVERGGAAPWRIVTRVPVTGGVRCERLVDPDDPTVAATELELRVGEDETTRLRVFARPAIEVERQVTQALGLLSADRR